MRDVFKENQKLEMANMALSFFGSSLLLFVENSSGPSMFLNGFK